MIRKLLRFFGWLLAGVLLAAGLITFTPWPSQLLARPLVVNETPSDADVLIVLGAGTRRNPVSLPPQAKDRLTKAKQLWDQGLTETVIVAGGFSRRTEAVESKYMKPFLASLGVPADDILEENQSLDTYQNAVNSLALMEKHEWQKAIVVTSDYHTWRGCRLFRKLKVEVTCVAAPLDDHNSWYERWINFRSVMREYGAIVYYWQKGYL